MRLLDPNVFVDHLRGHAPDRSGALGGEGGGGGRRAGVPSPLPYPSDPPPSYTRKTRVPNFCSRRTGISSCLSMEEGQDVEHESIANGSDGRRSERGGSDLGGVGGPREAPPESGGDGGDDPRADRRGRPGERGAGGTEAEAEGADRGRRGGVPQAAGDVVRVPRPDHLGRG